MEQLQLYFGKMGVITGLFNHYEDFALLVVKT